MMSDLPSPLKSPVPLMCQLAPGLNGPDRADERGVVPVHQPHRGGAIVVLPQDVGFAVAVEVARGLDVPAGTRVEGPDRADKRSVVPIHQPHRGRAVVVLPDDVGLAVAVEVAPGFDVPGRPRVAKGTDERGVGAVHQPGRGRAIVALPQNVGIAVAVQAVDRVLRRRVLRRRRDQRHRPCGRRVQNDLQAVAGTNTVELCDGGKARAIERAVLIDLQECRGAARIFRHPHEIADELAAAERRCQQRREIERVVFRQAVGPGITLVVVEDVILDRGAGLLVNEREGVELEDVGAGTSGQRVVPRLAVERVIAGAADERVVAGRAECRAEPGRCRRCCR